MSFARITPTGYELVDEAPCSLRAEAEAKAIARLCEYGVLTEAEAVARLRRYPGLMKSSFELIEPPLGVLTMEEPMPRPLTPWPTDPIEAFRRAEMHGGPRSRAPLLRHDVVLGPSGPLVPPKGWRLPKVSEPEWRFDWRARWAEFTSLVVEGKDDLVSCWTEQPETGSIPPPPEDGGPP